MPHLQKFQQNSLGHILAHYERSAKNYSNTNIDSNRTHLNYNLAPQRNCRPIEFINHYINEINDYRRNRPTPQATIRKDAVRLCDWVIQAPKDLAPEFQKEFFDQVYKTSVDHYGKLTGLGEGCIVSAYVHLDEETPHMHLAICPVIYGEDGSKRLCAKELISRNELRNFQQLLQKEVAEPLRCNILNGNTEKDAFGHALSVKELKARTRAERTRERNRF